MVSSPSVSNDLSLLSWNILAPCWVLQDWYPSTYDLANDHRSRLNSILTTIQSFAYDIILIQEAQEDQLELFIERLGQQYRLEYAPNNSTMSTKSNGLLTLIRKSYHYASEIQVINDILDLQRGDALQIIIIPSKNLYLLNLHLDYRHTVSQSKLIQERCDVLLGGQRAISLMAGDFNAEIRDHQKFGWTNYHYAFPDSTDIGQIPTYYSDPKYIWSNMIIDHIVYDPIQLLMIQCGKAWHTLDRTLEESLKNFGSDHIYIWATFRFS